MPESSENHERSEDVPRTVSRICRFPRNLRDLRDCTPQAVWSDSGYRLCRSEITQDDLEREITREPSLIDEWLRFSKDKRWSPAWYFLRG